jgi:hypothetical protein
VRLLILSQRGGVFFRRGNGGDAFGMANNKMCTALVVVITNKTRITFHPLRGLQFAETMLFFLLLLYPLRGLGWVQWNMFLMVCNDTNHGKKQ